MRAFLHLVLGPGFFERGLDALREKHVVLAAHRCAVGVPLAKEIASRLGELLMWSLMTMGWWSLPKVIRLRVPLNLQSWGDPSQNGRRVTLFGGLCQSGGGIRAVAELDMCCNAGFLDVLSPSVLVRVPPDRMSVIQVPRQDTFLGPQDGRSSKHRSYTQLTDC